MWNFLISNLVLLQFDRKWYTVSRLCSSMCACKFNESAPGYFLFQVWKVPLCMNQQERLHFNSCFELTISTQKVDVVSIKVNSTDQTSFPFSLGESALQPRGLHWSGKGVPTGPQLGSVCCCVWSVHILHCHFPSCVLPWLPPLLLLLLKELLTLYCSGHETLCF